MTEKSAALLVTALSGMIVLAVAIVSGSGLRPYDEQEINPSFTEKPAKLLILLASARICSHNSILPERTDC